LVGCTAEKERKKKREEKVEEKGEREGVRAKADRGEMLVFHIF
jgi:hypothetical protein